MKLRTWTVRVAAAAESDFQQILDWTVDEFGIAQARIYAETLADALEALTKGPSAIGVIARDDIAKGLLSLHVARGRRRGRHFVIFRVAGEVGSPVVEVLRILHDSMDLPRHLKGIGTDQ